jgi:hypothetical protein
MIAKKLVVALALLLCATSASLAQGERYHRPGPYFGNDYGPDNSATQSESSSGSQR